MRDRETAEHRLGARELLWIAAMGVAGAASIGLEVHAAGPLTLSDTHPPAFVDAKGQRVYLAGSHTWNNVADMDESRPVRPFDYPAYLEFLRDHQLNLTRLWAWEVPAPASDRYQRRQLVEPLPWARTGPGMARDQRPRFDLRQFDSEYFQRLRDRVRAAQENGIYAVVMLFEGWAVQFAPGKLTHPFGAENNINGIDFGEDPSSIHTLKHPDILAIQIEYLHKVVDTVNGFDNVLYEIVNEAGAYSTEWQAHMIAELASYQASKPNQHLIGMTVQHAGGNNATLIESQADWISPNHDALRLLVDPPTSMGTKVVISDSDHFCGSSGCSEDWVWRTFTRGLNVLYMDRYVPPDAVTEDTFARAHLIRIAMGDTRLIADALQRDQMAPRPELATTGFALAGDGVLLVYQPYPDTFIVDLSGLSGPLEIEWMNVVTGQTVRDERDTDRQSLPLHPPFHAPSVVLLYEGVRPGARTLLGLEQDFVAVRRAAMSYLSYDRYVMEWVRQRLAEHGPAPSYSGLVRAYAWGAAAILLLVLLLTGSRWLWRWRSARRRLQSYAPGQ